MKRRDFLEKWGLTGLKIKLGFLEGEFNPRDPDRAAACELYIELLTSLAAQYLPPEDGDEQAAALDSVDVIFPVTRDTMRPTARARVNSIPVLNQMIRPFTAKWHRRSLAGYSEEDPEHAVTSDPNSRRSACACATTPAPSPTWRRSRI